LDSYIALKIEAEKTSEFLPFSDILLSNSLPANLNEYAASFEWSNVSKRKGIKSQLAHYLEFPASLILS
jgi:hypothetical protein